jgi:hypothetical protein
LQLGLHPAVFVVVLVTRLVFRHFVLFDRPANPLEWECVLPHGRFEHLLLLVMTG